VLSAAADDKRFIVRLLDTDIQPGVKTNVAEVFFDSLRGGDIYVL
jgi:hypothetical protein